MAKTFLDKSGFLFKKRPESKTFTVPLERTKLQPVYFTDEELYAAKGNVLVFDLEIYPNYFLAAFKEYNPDKFKNQINLEKNEQGVWVKPERVVTFEICPWKPVFDVSKLLWVMHNFCLVGFNSNKFDIPLLWLAVKGASLEEINDAVEQIIKFDAMPRDIERSFNFKQGDVNTIDLIEVAPLSASLKTYGGRLHAQRLQDLPYDPNTALSESQAADVALYCINDLDLTALLLNELSPQLELRFNMSKEYGVDLRSKSDAQIAEAVICSELSKILGCLPRKSKISEGTLLQYDVPEFISFKSKELNGILEKIRNARFELDHLGSPKWPDGLGERDKTKDGKDKWVLRTQIGKSVYKIGMGGLHSSEKSISHFATEFIEISDNDVESFYPRIILNQRLFPKHLGEAFLTVYNTIVDNRIDAKAKVAILKETVEKIGIENFIVICDSLKIVINGSFGKLGSKYSVLYAPQLMLQVTISGQLCLLMLIEMLENAGIEVISGNTDGIVSKYSRDKRSIVRNVIKEWEIKTNFKTEETKYKAIFCKDVNNYYAIKEKGGDKKARFLDERLGVKTKGCFSERGSALNSVLSKNPEFLILTDAVQNLLVGNIPLEETILNCKDIRRFTTLRNVKGGAEQDGVYLGKVVRFYYSNKSKSTINYVISGNKVAKSEGSKPCMDLPETFPEDIDYDKYIKEAESILYEIGYLKKPEQAMFF